MCSTSSRGDDVTEEFRVEGLPKPSSIARLAALFVDEVIAAGPMLLLGSIGYYAVADTSFSSTWSLLVSITAYALAIFWPMFYMLTRDGWGHGQGWGKRLFGLLVVRAEGGDFATKGGSAARFLILGLLSLVEAIVVLVRPDGRRLGDLLAHTRVVGEREYAESEAPGAETVSSNPASRTMPVVALIVSAMLVASSIGLISFTVSRLAPGPVADEVAQTVYGDPDLTAAERTVERFYEDILSSSYDEALARFDMPQEQAFAAVSVYSDSGAILDDYEIVDSVLEDTEAVVTAEEVFVNEMGEQRSREVVYTLASVDGEMLITAVSSDEFDPLATAEALVVYPGDAEIVVDAFLGFIAIDEPAEAKGLATTRFASENPEYFDGSLGELASWDILGSEQLTSERLRVRVTEEWTSGTTTADYQAVLDGGELKVDVVSLAE